MASNDLELIRTALAGSHSAKRKLMRRLKSVERILTVQTRRMDCRLSHHEMQDLTQETMVRVWSKLEEFEGRATLETWLYRFCYLELMNFFRKKKLQLRPISDYGDDTSTEPIAPAVPADSDLEHMLRHLAPREAQVVRLRHLEQLDFREASEVLGVSTSTAKTSYYRALDKLRSVLNGTVASKETA